jgi:hypothetical protein
VILTVRLPIESVGDDRPFDPSEFVPTRARRIAGHRENVLQRRSIDRMPGALDSDFLWPAEQGRRANVAAPDIDWP